MPTPKRAMTKAEKAVDLIINDILNRYNLSVAWNEIDLDVRKDIRKKWAEKIRMAMNEKEDEPAPPPPPAIATYAPCPEKACERFDKARSALKVV